MTLETSGKELPKFVINLSDLYMFFNQLNERNTIVKSILAFVEVEKSA